MILNTRYLIFLMGYYRNNTLLLIDYISRTPTQILTKHKYDPDCGRRTYFIAEFSSHSLQYYPGILDILIEENRIQVFIERSK